MADHDNNPPPVGSTSDAGNDRSNGREVPEERGEREAWFDETFRQDELPPESLDEAIRQR